MRCSETKNALKRIIFRDPLKPPVAKRLCPNDFFGEVKCPGGSTVLLKNFVCNVIAPDAP